MAQERHTNNGFDLAEATPAGSTQEPQTLAAFVVGRGAKLTDTERRAILAADAMYIPLHDKRLLVAAGIYGEKGVGRVDQVLGANSAEAVFSRDSVKTDPHYQTLWAQHSFLIQPDHAEVAVLKRFGVKHAQIAERLGMERPQVERIVAEMIDFWNC